MADVLTYFRDADAIPSPDLWAEIVERAADPSAGEREVDLGSGPRQRWQRYVAVAAALTLAAGAFGLVVRALGPREHEFPGAAPEGWTVVDRIPLSGFPFWLDAANGSIWVSRAGHDESGISRVDPASDEVVSTISVPGVDGVVADAEGALWASTTRGVVRIDPETEQTALDVPMRGAPSAPIAAGFGSAWVGEYKGSNIRRVDAQTGDVTVIDTGTSWPIALVVTSDAVWSASLDGRVQAIDPASNGIVHMVDLQVELGESVNLMGIVAGEGSIWVTACGSASMDDYGSLRGCSWSLVRIDPATGRVTGTFDVGQTVETPTDDGLEISLNWVQALVASDGSLWIAVSDYAFHGTGNPFAIDEGEHASVVHSRLVRIDATTGEVIEQIPFGNGSIGDAVSSYGAIWLIDRTHEELIRLEQGA